jgi:uncharacterized RDD family membrane protein YckC
MFLVLALQASSSSASKANVLQRVLAKIIDLVIVVALAAILPYPLGPLLGFLYSLFADGMNFGKFRGQSVGKRVLNLQVLHLIRRKPATYMDSVYRNAPVGVATFFAIIPFWGWLILFLIGAPLLVMEVYLMLRVESGHRLGDVMGDTEVIEIRPPVR